MTRSGLGRVQSWWRANSLPTLPQSLAVLPLHPQSKSHRLCCNPVLRTHHCYSSSYIIKSPFKDIEITDKLIPEMIWESVDKFPESIAVKCGLTGRKYTFSEVQKLSQRFATSLMRAGFKPGEVIAMVLPNSPEFSIIILGALEAGLAVSLINHTYTADEMHHQLMDSGSVCVITASEKVDVVVSAITKVEQVTQQKKIRRIVAVDIPSPDALPTGVSRYTEMIADGNSQSIRNISKLQSNDLAFLPYSSGTTGLSKGVCLSHRNIVCNILQFSSVKGMELYSPAQGQDILLGLLPFYHIYGLVVILLNSLYTGAQVITLPKFEQDTFIHTMENEKLSVLMMVPPLMLFLGDSSKIKPKHLANVRYIMSGAAPLGASDLEKVKAKLPLQNNCLLSQGYGMTELSPVATVPIVPCKNMATVGVPIANTLGKVINPDTGEAVGPNKSGELCFKGPQVMMGYHNNPKATADMIDADGWLRTGDIGYCDEDGDFYIQDRLKELIKVKGLQVPPAELEELLRTHPKVSDVGVIGVPCPRSGEVPVAYVVPQKNKTLKAEEIKEFLAGRVSKHKQVAEVIFTDTIPKSAAGKILRKDLRQHYKSMNKA